MSDNPFDTHPDIIECRRRIDAAISSLATLHLGPLDYNVAATADDLRAADDHLRRFFEIQNSTVKGA